MLQTLMAPTYSHQVQEYSMSKESIRMNPTTTTITSNTITTTTASLFVIVLSFFIVSGLLRSIRRVYCHMTKYHKRIRHPPGPEPISPLVQRQDLVNDETLALSSGMMMTDIKRVHVIFCVHGWIGCPQDLGYVHHACEEQANKLQNELHRESEPFYVYTCVSNHGKTNDGIQAGGERVADEIRQFLQRVQEKHQRWEDGLSSLEEITISMIGYSLGGLYSRYALPRILEPLQRLPSTTAAGTSTSIPRASSLPPPPPPILTPKVFCTIATPHLGSDGHTYFPFPKPLQNVFGWFSQTGRDLFHRSDVIHRTVTDPIFVEPLLRFERRVAYANTYESDMMTPTSTAAFLSPNSPLEHFIIDDGDDNQDGGNYHQRKRKNPFMALIVETPAQHHLLREQLRRDREPDWSPLSRSWDHARRLDAMGWSKVFVDFTNSYQRPEGTTMMAEQQQEQSVYDEQYSDEDDTNTTFTGETSGGPSFRRRRSFQSSELHAEFLKSKKKIRALFPNGHDQIAVNSKNVLYSYTLRKGRPLIDQLANDFIRDILLGPSQSLLSSTSFNLSSSMSTDNIEDTFEEQRRGYIPKRTNSCSRMAYEDTTIELT
jgi:Putative serine esterase (DUF676)